MGCVLCFWTEEESSLPVMQRLTPGVISHYVRHEGAIMPNVTVTP